MCRPTARGNVSRSLRSGMKLHVGKVARPDERGASPAVPQCIRSETPTCRRGAASRRAQRRGATLSAEGAEGVVAYLASTGAATQCSSSARDLSACCSPFTSCKAARGSSSSTGSRHAILCLALSALIMNLSGTYGRRVWRNSSSRSSRASSCVFLSSAAPPLCRPPLTGTADDQLCMARRSRRDDRRPRLGATDPERLGPRLWLLATSAGRRP
jgi:hypothetical protein